MSTDREVTRTVRSWLEDGVTALPDSVLDDVLDQLPATPQRRAGWLARRFPPMNNAVRIALATAAVVVIALLGLRFFLPAQNVGGPDPSPIPTATPLDLNGGPLAAGTYAAQPFVGPEGGYAACPEASPPHCDATVAASIQFTFTVPDGWEAFEANENVIWLEDGGATSPDGASILFMRGSWLQSDPCAESVPDIEVGPTVDDFANALVDHPLLDTTTPVDVTLGGYSGKYLDLQIPSELLSVGCPYYRPWDPGIYAQGPGQRWHIWILDVDGIRVVIHADDYATTSEQHQAELQAIVASIQIEP